MRKLIVSLLAVAVMVAMPLCAEELEQWQVELRDYKEYQALRVEAKAAFVAGDYELACNLFLDLSGTAHCARRESVKACQLNSAAYSLLKQHEDKEGLISEEIAERCLEILSEAKALSQSICGTVIDKNITYCEERLK